MVRRAGAPNTPATKPASSARSPTTPHGRRTARAPWDENSRQEWTHFPIARLRYTAAGKSWTPVPARRNLRFHIYDLPAPSNRVDDLLNEIDRDPTYIFWG